MDSVFFTLSKLVWTMVQPDMALFILMILGVLTTLTRFRRLTRWLFATLVIVYGTIGFYPVGDFLIHPLESRYTPNPNAPAPDVIIVLGGAEDPYPSASYGYGMTNEAGDRLITAYALAQLHPNAHVLYTGGSGNLLDQSFSGADIAAEILMRMGLSPHRLSLEKRSRNTFENAINSKAMIDALRPKQIALVTSAYHMPRSIAVFCKAGYVNITPYPTDFRSGIGQRRFVWDFPDHLLDLDAGLREWLGLIAYYATGKIDTAYPKGC